MSKEYIERGALIESLNKLAPEHYNALINGIIMEQPAADVVEVVRCKYCRYNTGEHKCIYPDSIIKVPKDDDFCSYGERKTDE